jgi:hypothetical protein
MTQGSELCESNNFLFFTTTVQASCRSRQWVTGNYSQRVKRTECDANHYLYSMPEITRCWTSPSQPPIQLHALPLCSNVNFQGELYRSNTTFTEVTQHLEVILIFKNTRIGYFEIPHSRASD